MMDCNRLLKFAKENSDVGLVYDPLGPVQELRLLCFCDAAFATRNDSSSQLGYIIVLIHGNLLKPDGPEGAYHIVDWKSQKTPRVARSSLGAEAQAGGQACDALEHVCVFWNCLRDPRQKLQDLLDCKSPLAPTMVTDAKALYDSFHREGYSNSVVDKRVSLEVRVMKERLLALGGNLRWMSSERQLADGLTKVSARNLLAQRLRYGKLKLIWDPIYKAAKKKTKDELKASIQESALSPAAEADELHQAPRLEHDVEQNEELTEVDPVKDYVHITEDTVSYFMEAYEYNILSEEHEARVNDTTAAPSHVGSRMQYVIKCRLRNVLLWAFVLLLLPGAVASDTGLAEEPDFLTVTVITILSLLASTLFLLGRWSRRDWAHHQKVLCVDATTQTEDTTVSSRLRAEIEEWKLRTLEAEGTAMENGKALKLAIANMEYVGELTYRAGNILRRCLRETDAHRLECPLHVGIFIFHFEAWPQAAREPELQLAGGQRSEKCGSL